jgi:hypothetical protein
MAGDSKVHRLGQSGEMACDRGGRVSSTGELSGRFASYNLNGQFYPVFRKSLRGKGLRQKFARIIDVNTNRI